MERAAHDYNTAKRNSPQSATHSLPSNENGKLYWEGRAGAPRIVSPESGRGIRSYRITSPSIFPKNGS